MDDRLAFERRVADEVVRGMGPPELVDDRAVFDAVTAATPRRTWGSTMFTAIRLVAAAVIVALFGGFLINGVLTTPHEQQMLPATQSGGRGDMTYVRMTLNGSIERVPPEEADLADGFQSRGGVYEWVYEADDPRIDGTYTFTRNRDGGTGRSAADLMWGTITIENDGGSWEGPFTGFAYVLNGEYWVASASLTGSGDYDGLTFYFHASGPDTSGTGYAHGIIYEG